MFITTSEEGNVIKLGTNQQENQEIINNADPTWIWFHADKFSSGHAVIETDSPTKHEIIQVAILVKERCKLKHYSKGKIIYCPVKNLKKTGVPGEVDLKRRPKTVTV